MPRGPGGRSRVIKKPGEGPSRQSLSILRKGAETLVGMDQAYLDPAK